MPAKIVLVLTAINGRYQNELPLQNDSCEDWFAMAGLHRFQITFQATNHDFRAARHPSEAKEWFVARVLARVLHDEEGLTFSQGVCRGELPALYTPDTPGRFKTWIDIGCPSEKKLRLALRTAERTILYTYGQPHLLAKLLAQCEPGRVEAWHLERGFLQGVAGLITAPTLRWEMGLEGERLVVAGQSTTRTALLPRLREISGSAGGRLSPAAA